LHTVGQYGRSSLVWGAFLLKKLCEEFSVYFGSRRIERHMNVLLRSQYPLDVVVISDLTSAKYNTSSCTITCSNMNMDVSVHVLVSRYIHIRTNNSVRRE
jgi:hypothetical protein